MRLNNLPPIIKLVTEPGFKHRQRDFEFILLTTVLPLHVMVFLFLALHNLSMLLCVFLTLRGNKGTEFWKKLSRRK